MPKVGQNEINTQQFRRNFIQHGGPRPNAALKFSGLDGQYMIISDLTVNDSGDIEYLRVPDPLIPGALRTVARSRSAPDPDEATLTLLEKRAALPWYHFKQNCAFNVYEMVGSKCVDLSDFNSGWDSYVRVLSYCEVSSKSFGALQAWEDDGQNEAELGVTLATYSVGALQFGLKAASTITTEVADVVFGKQVRCGDCGIPNDGTAFIYAVQRGVSSPASKPAVIYSTNGGASWSSITISTAANSESVAAIDIVGDKLVVLSTLGGTGAASCLYVSSINSVTGVPSTTFTKVTPTVFNSTNVISDMHVVSPSAVFFVGVGGYIYKSADILSDMTLVSAGDATVSDLKRITGVDQTLYAVGASAAVIVSNDGGTTWTVTTTLPGAATVNAVAVLDPYRAWVGDSAGAVYYTLDGGATWTAKSFTGLTATAVQDIAFATDEVAMIAFTISGPVSRIATTLNGGERWVDSGTTSRRLGSVPSAETINRIAFPTTGDSTVNVNTVAVCGLGSNPDGVLMIGTAARV